MWYQKVCCKAYPSVQIKIHRASNTPHSKKCCAKTILAKCNTQEGAGQRSSVEKINHGELLVEGLELIKTLTDTQKFGILKQLKKRQDPQGKNDQQAQEYDNAVTKYNMQAKKQLQQFNNILSQINVELQKDQQNVNTTSQKQDSPKVSSELCKIMQNQAEFNNELKSIQKEQFDMFQNIRKELEVQNYNNLKKYIDENMLEQNLNLTKLNEEQKKLLQEKNQQINELTKKVSFTNVQKKNERTVVNLHEFKKMVQTGRICNVILKLKWEDFYNYEPSITIIEDTVIENVQIVNTLQTQKHMTFTMYNSVVLKNTNFEKINVSFKGTPRCSRRQSLSLDNVSSHSITTLSYIINRYNASCLHITNLKQVSCNKVSINNCAYKGLSFVECENININEVNAQFCKQDGVSFHSCQAVTAINISCVDCETGVMFSNSKGQLLESTFKECDTAILLECQSRIFKQQIYLKDNKTDERLSADSVWLDNL